MSAPSPQKILVIQNAFIGDVILATALVETLHHRFPEAEIDMMVKKGAHSVLAQHPFLGKLWIWEKSRSKYRNLVSLAFSIRNANYDLVVNPHRFFSSGLITAISGARWTSGFQKNPLSFLYNEKHPHDFSGLHEIERNHQLIASITELSEPLPPRLYPTKENYDSVARYVTDTYYCMAPASVWFTKMWPAHKWVELIQHLPKKQAIYLLGGPDDEALCENIRQKSGSERVTVLAGKLSLLESAALMKSARMNFVNDSGPMHLCSSLDAPTTAIYCSTDVSFGFGPLSSDHRVVQHPGGLECRPCGLHGKKECPLGHFKCAEEISIASVLDHPVFSIEYN